VECFHINERAVVVEPSAISVLRLDAHHISRLTSQKVTSKVTQATFANPCQKVSSVWATLVQALVRLRTDGQEVNNDGTQEEIR
jgi:hypothetical protein